jgi:hypothetical protein
MAIGPIDYMGGMPQVNLAQQFTQGLQAGAAVEQLQVARQQRDAQMQAAEEARMRQEAFRNNFSAYLEKPTARGWAALVAENPGMREALGDINKTLSAEQAKAEQKDALELYNALNTDPAVATQILDSRIEAARNSGLPTQELEAIRARMETSPSLVQGLALMQAAAGPDGDKILKGIADAEESRRKALLFPDAARTAAASATRAEAEAVSAQVAATNAPELARIEVAQKGAAAKIEQFKAREEELRAAYAPQRVKIEVEKLGADLGLTRAQIGQATAAAAASRASAAASSASAQAARATAERERIGLLPPDKRAEAEAKLRAEYSKETKNFQDVRESYRRVKSSEDTAAGDISLIFGFMKMLDPASVVREGEFATAQNAAGIPVRLRNAYNKALSGKRLDPKQVAEFRSQANALYKAAGVQEETVRNGLSRVATSYGLNTKNIFFDDAAPPTPAPTPSPDKKPPLSSFLK